MPDETAVLLSEARDLAESAPADFGYSWLDSAGKVIVNVATQRGASRYANWRPAAVAAKAAHSKRDVQVSMQRFEEMRDDIAARIAKHEPGFDHIVMVGPDGENDRLIISVNSIDDHSLGVLARRYGTELVAIRYEPNEVRPSVTAGRFDDRSSGGFYGGSSIRVDDTASPYQSHGCSTAFSWRSLDNTVSYMLTAGHCAPVGGTVVTATANLSTVESMGIVYANSRENWNDATGTTPGRRSGEPHREPGGHRACPGK